MHFSAVSVVSVAMMLLSASARSIEKVRSDAGGMTVEQASQQCGNDQTISCCNTSTTDNASGLLGANAANGLLGGSCTVIPVTGQFSRFRDLKTCSNILTLSSTRPFDSHQPGLCRQPSSMLHW